ncbi:MAG: hypothetical protein V1808_03465 [Candidatus Daviesbacteria bacterium]
MNHESVGQLLLSKREFLKISGKGILVAAIGVSSVGRLMNAAAQYLPEDERKDSGEVDDSGFFQEAINRCFPGEQVIIPWREEGYCLRQAIHLKDKTVLLGEGDENHKIKIFFLPSKNEYQSIFYGQSLKNIEIGGFSLHSEFTYDRLVDIFYGTSLSSNILGIHLTDSYNCFLHDIEGQGLEYLFKIDSNRSGTTRDYQIDNIFSENVHTPIYLGRARKIYGRNWNLGCPHASETTRYDHQLYIAGDSEEIIIDRLVGWGGREFAIQISGYKNQRARDITISNIELLDKVFTCVTEGYVSDISLSGLVRDTHTGITTHFKF